MAAALPGMESSENKNREDSILPGVSKYAFENVKIISPSHKNTHLIFVVSVFLVGIRAVPVGQVSVQYIHLLSEQHEDCPCH